jgi:hypothetical protein
MLTIPTVFAIAVAAIGLFIVARGQVYNVRQACGSITAERVVIGANIIAFLLYFLTALTYSMVVLVLAASVMVGTIVAARSIVEMTGGPDRICQFRRVLHEIFSALHTRPFTDENLATARSAFSRLDSFRSPMTARVIGAVGNYLDLRFPELDRAAAIRADDELQAAIAELRAKHPW